MFEFLIILLVLMWFLGGTFAVGGNLLNVLLVIALVIIVIRLVQGQRL